MPHRRPLSAMLCVAVVAAFGIVGAEPSAAASPEVLTPPASGAWQVQGRGYGHGIGMSQWGAQAAALAGLSADGILDFYYPGTQRYDIGQDYPLRVLLSSASGSTVSLAPEAGDVLTVADQGTGASFRLPAGAQLQAQRTGGVVTLTSLLAGQDAGLTGPGGSALAGPFTVTSSQAQLWVVSSSGSAVRYPGSIALIPSGLDAFQVVNQVPMEQYLRGVVPREVPSSWSRAALEAQAIAARTYALAVRNAMPTYDICDTTACQVYGGSATRSASGTITQLFAASTDTAVAATARIARYFGGGPAFTQFSSSNGGWSRAGSQPYLMAAADPYTGTAPGDTVSRWTSTLSVQRVQQSCPSGGALQSMALSRDGNGDFGGRIVSAKLVCSTGTVTVNTPAFGLLSNWWEAASTFAPFGGVDSIVGAPGADLTGPVLGVSGWAADSDAPTSAVSVDILVDGTVAATMAADALRPDVATAFPWMGPNHGFASQLHAPPGSHRVCVVAANLPYGPPVTLGCGSVVLPGGAPRGAIDAVSAADGQLAVSGWALDPGSTASVNVEVVAQNGDSVSVIADTVRPDVAAAFPGYGSDHGYRAVLPLSASSWVCVRVVNPATGSSTLLGCPAVPRTAASPIGNLEAVDAGIGTLAASGWAFDPSASGAISVRLSVDGRDTLVVADAPRDDVARAYSLSNAQHGFQAALDVSAGPHTLCVTAIGVGSNTSLGCRTVVVPGGSPIGAIEAAAGVPGGLTLSGWALDPDVAASPYVWVDVDGLGHFVRATGARPDVAAVYPGYGSLLGWSDGIAAAAGAHRVCVTVNNVGAGSNTFLGCRTISVGGQPGGTAG